MTVTDHFKTAFCSFIHSIATEFDSCGHFLLLVQQFFIHVIKILVMHVALYHSHYIKLLTLIPNLIHSN